MKNKFYILFFCIVKGLFAFTQTTTMVDNVTFSTSGQNMWGPGLGFTLDKNIPLIPQTSFGGPPSTIGGISNIGSFGQFGVLVEAGMWGSFGSNFYIKDVTGGSIDVTYPIETSITYPSANTINRGEWITINTDYIVRNGWKLDTYFPTTGSMGVDFNFNFGVKFKTQLCAFSCVTPVDLDFNASVNFDIFKLSANEIIYPTITNYYIPGSCNPPPLICNNPVNLPGGNTLPALTSQPGLPFVYPPNQMGLSGFVDIPFVNTTDNLQPNKCLTASGSYKYFEINLDVLKFMSKYVPPPVGPLISQLSGSYNAGPFYLNYNLLKADLNLSNTTYQNFSFCPTIKSNFHFISPVFFEEITPTGTIVNSGQLQNITITTGNDLRIKYPCNFEFTDVNVDYDLENQFSNHTYDEIAINFILSSMDFNVGMNSITVLPSGCFDPCFGAFGGCKFCWSGITFPGFSYGTGGPLYSYTLPIASIPYDWYNGTWELGGFTNQAGGTFTLDAMPYYAQSTSTPVDCYGDNTGSMQVNVTNGVPPFNYIWSDGLNDVSGSSTFSHNFEAGYANVIVEDANGCQAATSQLITEPIDSLHSINSIVKNVDCNGNNTGEISIDMVGGNPPYTYSWTPMVSNSNIASNLVAGTYSVTVTDTKGCAFTKNFIVMEPSILTAYDVVNSNVSCFGGNDGSITVFASGGTYPYSYNWSNGDNFQTVNGLSAGNYTCVITDANNCQTSVNTVITEPSQPIQLSIAQTPLSCYNNSSGQINLTVTGGTTPYTFDWYNGQFQQLSQHVEDPINLQADYYQVNVVDANGCFDTISVQVTQPDELIISDSIITEVLCYGNNTGAIDITVIGGTTPYSFNWNNGTITEDNQNLIAGIYNVTITDVNGCVFVDTFKIVQPSSPVVITSNNTNVLCYGDFTGSIDVSVVGGTPPYIYSWNNGYLTEDINNLQAGNYTLTLIDNHNCNYSFTTTINQPLAPLSSSNLVTDVSCFNFYDGSILNTTTGGTPPYFYQWNNSNNIILTDTTFNPQNLPSDSYTLILTDNNNCQIETTSFINQPDSLVISFSSVDVLCTNNNTGSIDATINGGNTPYSYNWSNGATSQDINNLVAGNYTLTVVDNNNCTATNSINISEPEETLTIQINKKDVECKGDSTGIAECVTSGGTSPYTINWSNGDTTAFNDSLSAGVYTVTITDNNNCIANSGIIINEPPTYVSFNAVVTDASCYNFTDGIIEITPFDGTTPYTLIFGDTLFNSYNNLDNNYILNNLHQGTYHIRIKDVFGCEYEELISVNQPDSLIATGVVTDALCFGSSDGMVDLTVTGGTLPYSFAWSDSSYNEDLVNVYSGWYNVEVLDSQNCEASAVFFINQPEDITIKETINPTTCRDNEDGSISIFVEGGTPDYTYLWSTNEVTETIYDLAPGTYTVQVFDEHNCIKTDTFIINQSEIDCIQPPTAFTPDGDGINDTWILDNINNYPNATVQIYNKWGNLLYETTNGNYIPWNGYYEGNRLPTATYYYIINLNNGDAPYTGPITIVINE